MLRLVHVLALALVASLAVGVVSAGAQTATSSAPHTVIVKLIERGGSVPYAFEPASIDVARGDTVRFVQAANAPHNVRFTKQAPGAKLGSASTSPYLVAKGQTYVLVIDGRFTDGNYTYVCDPHEMIGMHGSMTVTGGVVAGGGK